MDRPTVLLIVVLAISMLTLIGCNSEPVYAPDKALQAALVAEFKVAGRWSPPAAGLRCRLLLESDRAVETNVLSGALVIENVTGRSIVLRNSGSPPFGAHALHWRADDQWQQADPPATPAAQITTQRANLSPGEQLVLAGDFLVPPGPGQRQISAAFATAEGQTLLTPPIIVTVAPAAWGQSSDGIRLRLSSRKLRYVVGENLMLDAFIHNIEHDSLAIHPPDWPSLQIDVRRDIVLMRASTADAQYAPVPRGQFWWSPLPTSLLLAPGKYIFRLDVVSPELPVTNARAWHGRVISNDVAIEVVAQ